MKRFFVLGVCAGLLLLGAGCEDVESLGGVAPHIGLTQDWDKDGSYEPLPEDPGEGTYLLDFGQVVVKQKSTRYITITNTLDAEVALSWSQENGIRLSEGSSPDFHLDRPPVNSLQPGESTELSVYYLPMEEGADSGSIIFETNDPDYKGKTLAVTLAGEGVKPDIQVCLIDPGTQAETCHDDPAVSKLAVDFGMNDLGDSVSRDFVVRNLGVFALTLSAGGGQAGVDFSTGISSEYALSPEPWSGQLQPGESRQFTVTYQPFDGGADQGRVEVSSDDPEDSVVAIELLGNGLAPKICPQPPFIVDFGSIAVNSTSQKTYRFTSCGNQVLTITSLTIDSGVHGYFTFAASIATPLDLSPGEAFDVEMTYAPTQIGSHAGKLNITSNDPNAGEGYIDLVGRCTPVPTCDVYVWPMQVDFGQVSTSGFSNKTVSISNTGDADCEITEIRNPTGSGEFTLASVPPRPIIIPPGDQRQFSVQYKPVDEGVDQGTVTVVCPSDPDETETDVALVGEGVQPPPCDFQVDPALLNFGSVPVGGSRDMTVKVYNFGSEECSIWAWDMLPGSDPAFRPAGSAFPPPSVDPGMFHEITVSFQPETGGMLTGQMEIKGGENPFQTQKVYVSMTGGGESARMCINPTVLDFGPLPVGQHRDLSFTVTSCASGNLKVRQVVFDGVNADFTFTAAPGTPFTLPAGQSRSISVRYSPSDPGADFGRVLVSANDDQNSTVAVELLGNYTGTCPSVFDCQPAALSFPETDIGQSAAQAFICTNHGTESLTVTGVSLGPGTSPEFHLSAPGIPRLVAPGGQLHVEVDYVPTDVGTDVGDVRIQSEFTAEGCDNFTLITVPIDGVGRTPDLPECITPRVFNPVLEFSWPNGSISMPTWDDVFMTPIVINLTDDNQDGFINENDIPEIVFNSHQFKVCLDPRPEEFAECLAQPAVVRAISGDDGREIFTVDDPRFRTNFETQLAAGDIDGDNLPEILASKRVVQDTGDIKGMFVTGNILCFEHDGTFKWESEPWHAPEEDIEDGSALGIADLDHDGHPEIFRGASVFDHNGRLLWEGEAGRGSIGHGCFSTAADLDGVGGMELIAGNTAYHADGTVMWQADKPDGLMGVADFNQDGHPEVILFASGFGGGVFILDGATGGVLSSLSSAQHAVNAILPPVIADIDGTGGPEVGVVGTCSDPNAGPDEDDFAECFWGIDVNESTFAMNVIWEEIIDDQTLGGGNSGFDFEGDGPFEVLQNDEQYVHIYSGLAHNVIYSAERRSVTGWELPIVVDVDNDDHAEIILIQNGIGMAEGILVYGNIDNDWVATRRVWNQFEYHITNVRENGKIPRFEVPNWRVYNNFLTNEPFCE